MPGSVGVTITVSVAPDSGRSRVMALPSGLSSGRLDSSTRWRRVRLSSALWATSREPWPSCRPSRSWRIFLAAWFICTTRQSPLTRITPWGRRSRMSDIESLRARSCWSCSLLRVCVWYFSRARSRASSTFSFSRGLER